VEEAKRCVSTAADASDARFVRNSANPRAIDYLVKPEEERISVGSIIIAAGFDE
jgi:heterodisulfide reductase subunit A-like polyferredoxin